MPWPHPGTGRGAGGGPTVGFRCRRVRLSSAVLERAALYPGQVDTDAFIAVHRPQWDRLQELTRSRTLDAEGVDELMSLYQETATHLSTVRSTNPDPARSEEHTSELQSRGHLVCRLLLETKNNLLV